MKNKDKHVFFPQNLPNTICFGQNLCGAKTAKTRKHYKNSGFRGDCLKPKMTPFFDKKIGMGDKVVFTNCVFSSLCSAENTISLVFQQRTAIAAKRCMLKKTESRKICRLFLNMAKGFFRCLFHVWFVVVGCVVFVCFCMLRF